MWTPSQPSLRIAALGAVLVVGAVLFASGPERRAAGAGPAALASYDESWLPQADMGAARRGHIAAALPDGTVLVAGGIDGPILDSAELYDPVADTWTALPAMGTPRYLPRRHPSRTAT